MTKATRRLVDGLGSLRLAVVLMVALGVTCTIATFYEASHGTPATQRSFYGTWWFAGLLALLGVNIFASMLTRLPWRARHAGFLIAHVGILLLLVGSLVSLRFGLDSSMALYEGETSDRLTLSGQAVDVRLADGAAARFDADFDRHPALPLRLPVAGNGMVLVVEDYVQHARVSDELTPEAAGPAAVHVRLASAYANQDLWLWAGSDETSRATLGPVTLAIDGSVGCKTPPSGSHEICFAVDAYGRVRYALAAADGVRRGVVTVGEPLRTPWMGMTATVDQVLAHAATRRAVEPDPAPARGERREPAIKVHVERPEGRSASEWLVWSEMRALAVADRTVEVGYRAPERTVPFRVSLLRFNADRYPGSAMAASYESTVRIEDPERGTSEHLISMNHPLHYRGYVFFQSSYVDGQPMMSILSVSRAPGLPLVYLGVALISGGVGWMFYLKPHLARRQAARALDARQVAPAPVA